MWMRFIADGRQLIDGGLRVALNCGERGVAEEFLDRASEYSE